MVSEPRNGSIIHSVTHYKLNDTWSNKLEHPTETWWDCVCPYPRVQVKFDITYRHLRCLSRLNKLPQASGTVFDFDLKVKVKFDITNEFLRWLSYWYSLHFICLSCSNNRRCYMLLFSMYMNSLRELFTLVWPFRGQCEHVYLWVSTCLAITTGSRLLRVITKVLSNCLILQHWILYSLLWPLKFHIAHMVQRFW